MFMFNCCVDWLVKEHIAALTFDVFALRFHFEFGKKNEKYKIQVDNTLLKMLKPYQKINDIKSLELIYKLVNQLFLLQIFLYSN